MPVRQLCQALVARVPEHLPGALEQRQRGRARQAAVQLVGRGQQQDVGARVLAPERPRRPPAPVAQLPVRQIASGSAAPAGPATGRWCAPGSAAAGPCPPLAQLPVREPPQHPCDVLVGLLAGRHQHRPFRIPSQEAPQLFQPRVSLQLDVQKPPSHALHTPLQPPFRLMSRWKRLVLPIRSGIAYNAGMPAGASLREQAAAAVGGTRARSLYFDDVWTWSRRQAAALRRGDWGRARPRQRDRGDRGRGQTGTPTRGHRTARTSSRTC